MTNDTGGVESSDSAVVFDLDSACTVNDVEAGELYLATVNGVVEYGIFVDLSDTVSGLVHQSNLDRSYDVGEELVVSLEEIRANGDLSFDVAAVETYDVEPVSFEPELTSSSDLEVASGETVHVEGEVAQIKQTAGPTIFQVNDGQGVVPCTAFEEAGVRAYPDVDVGDVVRVSGTVERREDALQVEVEAVTVLDGDDAADAVARIDAGLDARAEPHDVDPLVEWPALERLFPDLREVARLLRRMVLESRPIRMRHHADGDGMCASVPLELALERFIAETHEDPDAPRHLLRRLPSKAPFYEMEDATRDLNFALKDRARHGQKLPLLLMLDNGSTEEDVPAYENLAHYDIPIAVIDHHHPDPEAVDHLLRAHVNPYLHGGDYRITTGMMCVELARMIDPTITEELGHVPAVAGICDRSKAETMADYLALANEAGYDRELIDDVGEALDYAAYWLKYDDGQGLIRDVLNVGCDDEERHRELVEFLSRSARDAVDAQLDAALPHVEEESLSNGAQLFRIDVENFAHRFIYPAPGTTTGAIHDRKAEAVGGPVITIGYGPDFAVLRSDGVRLDIPTMVDELTAEIDGGGVNGGGHLVVGSIKFVKGMREVVLDALVEKMAEAELDEGLRSTAEFPDPEA